MTDDLLNDALLKLRSNANAARGTKKPERRRELMISIGIEPEGEDPRLSNAALSGDGAPQEMGDEGEFMEGDAGIPGGVERHGGVVPIYEDMLGGDVSEDDPAQPRRGRLPVTR